MYINPLLLHAFYLVHVEYIECCGTSWVDAQITVMRCYVDNLDKKILQAVLLLYTPIFQIMYIKR